MADYAVSNPVESIPAEKPQRDVDLPSYRYAKALCESARSNAKPRTTSFSQKWKFLLGRDQWAVPGSTAAAKLDAWSFRGVVNWAFATVKTKSAMICGSPAEVYCEPLDDESTYLDRLYVKSAIDHDLARLRFTDIKQDAYLSGSVTGVGITMTSVKPDPLTGAMATVLTPIKSNELFPDPSCDSITSPNCRYVVWEPELDMSTVKDMFPTKARYVKPTVRGVSGEPTGITYKTTGSDDNLIYGTAGEFVVDQRNVLLARKAVVSFVWVRDETVIEELQEVLLKEAGPGYRCISCDAVYEQDAFPMLDGAPCPHCGGDMESVDIPRKMEQNTVIRRKYPYGRLIVYSADTLLFDGENPLEIESVFPFAVYHHERIPGDFWGSNDVDLLESLQQAQNRTVGQLIDYVRLCVNGAFEYPVGAKSYTDMGNSPGERHPVPDHLAGKAHYVIPDGFNVQAWQSLHSALGEHFQVVSGLGNVGFSQTSSPPISATEAEIANSRLSDRMKGHAQAFASYCSDVASLDYQLLKQFSDSPMNVAVTMPDSEVKSVELEVQKLPKVRVKVQINTQDAVKDKILGQNSVPIFTNPAMMQSPFLGEVLEGIGHPASRVKEILQKRALQSEMVPPGVGMPPPGPAPQPQGGPVG